jgi:hypothetical protein
MERDPGASDQEQQLLTRQRIDESKGARGKIIMGHKIGVATACLHISAVLSLIIGVLMFPLLMGCHICRGRAGKW